MTYNLKITWKHFSKKKWHNWIVRPYNSIYFILYLCFMIIIISLLTASKSWKISQRIIYYQIKIVNLPENMAAKSEITHSGEFCPIMATERCRLMPTWMKPRATNSTSLRYRSYVHVFQSPFRLTLSAITCKKKFNILSPAINWVCSKKNHSNHRTKA